MDLNERRRSAAHEIVAPRIAASAGFPIATDVPGGVHNPKEARRWVDAVAVAGADGIKFLGSPPDVMQAALAEAKIKNLRSACHHAQLAVARMNVLDTSSWGLTSMEHWYGLPEANFKVLYGTGAQRLNDSTGKVERVGGVLWTIHDGIVYDARALLADVRRMVAEAKAKEGPGGKEAAGP